jgi:hypothetical protein
MRRLLRTFTAMTAILVGLTTQVARAEAQKGEASETLDVATDEGPYIAEGLPKKVRTALAAANERDAEIVTRNGRNEYVIRRNRRWTCSSTVTVAFKGGSRALRRAIADATADWTAVANVKLDFGRESDGFRSWSPTDTEYAADVRISFDDPAGGYFSLVGKDSNSPTIVGTGEASMNYEGFADRLPRDWRGTVLHEFGHALGFEHEHQHPADGCDFRWDDDPGYQPTRDEFEQFTIDAQGRRPGIYTVLGGPPNEWSEDEIDFNLKKLQNTRAYRSSGALDRDSIMKYFFEDWMFVGGAESKCSSEADNLTLSATDKEGTAWAYPTPCAP